MAPEGLLGTRTQALIAIEECHLVSTLTRVLQDLANILSSNGLHCTCGKTDAQPEPSADGDTEAVEDSHVPIRISLQRAGLFSSLRSRSQ